jgi:cell division septal protein FtsQ
VRRASAGLTPTRVGALRALVAALAAIYGATASAAFGARDLVVDGATWTSQATIRATLALDPDQNLFVLRTDELAARLAALPTVRRATVGVGLPNTLRVSLVEREPLLTWRIGSRSLLVDEEGVLFADVGPTVPAAAAPLPVIEDARRDSVALGAGDVLDPIDLDAALRLGSLSPADLGSAEAGLSIRLDDREGFVVRARPGGWAAVFGFYTPSLRTTELIPGQVRLLRSLLDGRETEVARVVLADDRNGTYVPRSPAPEPTP